MTKISIIIPLYLSSNFIEKLNESLIKQTFHNLEIIYINDESPDDSYFKVLNAANNDDRIKIINKQNEGQAAALNDGINVSTGDYIMFLDADDWIEINTCELAFETAAKYDADMVFWPNIKEYASKSVYYPGFFNSSKLFDKNEMSFLRRRMIGLIGKELEEPMKTDAFNAGWGKLYKADIIKRNGIKWTDTKIVGSSDVLFNAQLIPYIKRAFYLDKHLHHYNKNNPNSLTQTYNDTLKVKFENLFIELDKVIKKHYSKQKIEVYSEALNNRIALSIINIGLGYSSKGLKSNGYKLFNLLLKSNPYKQSLKALKTKYLPIHFRGFFYLAKRGMAIPAFFLLMIMSKMRDK